MSEIDTARRIGVRRWSEWLRVKLRPEPIRFEGVSGAGEAGARSTVWRIRFRSGGEVGLHVPSYLVRSDDAVFERVVLGLDSYDWVMLPKREAAAEFSRSTATVSCSCARAEPARGEVGTANRELTQHPPDRGGARE